MQYQPSVPNATVWGSSRLAGAATASPSLIVIIPVADHTARLLQTSHGMAAMHLLLSTYLLPSRTT